MPEFCAYNWNQLTLFNSAIMKYAKTLGPFSKWDKFSGFQQNSWINCKGVVLYDFMMWNPAQFHRLTGSWCTPRKHGTTHIAYFDIYAIEMSLVVKNDSSVHFDFFFFFFCGLLSPPCNFGLIFWHFSHQKFYISVACRIPNYRKLTLKGWFLKIKFLEKTVYKVLFTNDHILKSRMSMNFGIKLYRPIVCSSQWYQKLILPRISLVSCFDGVPHKCVLISPLWARIN